MSNQMEQTLRESLHLIAPLLGVPSETLYQYALEDRIGGYHADERKAKWPIGSMWEVEGQTLYAIIRTLKPHRLLELGSFYGCSTSHIRKALSDNGQEWELTCVDVNTGAGAGIRPSFKFGIDWQYMDIDQYVEETEELFDFIFLDGNHSAEQSAHVWTRAKSILNGGGVMVEHDALHFLVGEQIRRGIQTAGVNPVLIKSWPSDCGLAVWRKEQKPLEAMSRDELEQVAKSRGVYKTSIRTVPALIDAIRESEQPVLSPQVDAGEIVRLRNGETITVRFAEMTRPELLSLARSLGLVIRGNIKTDTIIQRIREVEAG